ncbi:hypothetical protein KAF25_011085, partial [Fusarium avenaceum]
MKTRQARSNRTGSPRFGDLTTPAFAKSRKRLIPMVFCGVLGVLEVKIGCSDKTVSFAEHSPHGKCSAARTVLLRFVSKWDTVIGLRVTVFRNLDLQQGRKILVRGATSSFGKTAINLVVDTGAIVTATTRSQAKFAALTELGVFEAVLETPNLSKCLHESHNFEKVDVVLELIGNSPVVDSLQLVRRDALVCLAGWLGGLDPIKGPARPDKSRGFNPLLQMASG